MISDQSFLDKLDKNQKSINLKNKKLEGKITIEN